MPIFAIDPGNVYSAYVIYYPDTHKLGPFGKVENKYLAELLEKHARQWDIQYSIEMIASYGMPVGASVFDTCRWIGRFEQIIGRHNRRCNLVFRKEVKYFLCNSVRAKDGNVRQAIIDRFPPSGGGAIPQIGTKKNQGDLYGVSKDVWAAIGVALTAHNDMCIEGEAA